MALIEYATNEITEQVLGYCDCGGDADGNIPWITQSHEDECAIFPVMRLLDRALGVQRADLIEALDAVHEAGRIQIAWDTPTAQRLARAEAALRKALPTITGETP